MSFADDYINDQLELSVIAGDLSKASLLRELLNTRKRAERAEDKLEKALSMAKEWKFSESKDVAWCAEQIISIDTAPAGRE